ncbi:MAG: R3H domain-containing nucleic acid-binding protein [Bryobacteraceae bacterium]
MSERQYTVDTVGDRIADFLDAVLDAMDLDVEYEILDGPEAGNYFEKPSLVVKFSGPDLHVLTNNKAEVLLALEQLTQEVLRMAPDEHALICFDANDTRLLRQEELRLSALTVAERVRETKTPYRFSPMNSRERRLIHLALRDMTDLRSESSGTGPYRHVVVYPAGMPSLPEPPVPPVPPRRPHGGSSQSDRRGRRDGGRRGDDNGGRGSRGPRGKGRGGRGGRSRH